MGVEEAKVEKFLTDEVVKMGWTSKKQKGQNGETDRIISKNDVVWFVEVKTLNGRLQPNQIRKHRQQRSEGANVFTVYGKQGVRRFIDAYL